MTAQGPGSAFTPTPGPWEVGRTYSTHYHPERYWETNVYWAGEIVAKACGANQEEAEANARLIAASPDLLAALQALVLACNPERGRGRSVMDDDPPLPAARAAIAKALGQ